MTNEAKTRTGFRGLVQGATGTISNSPTIQKVGRNPGTIIRRPR